MKHTVSNNHVIKKMIQTQWERERAVCRSVFLTRRCIFSAELTKNALLQAIFWGFCPLGVINAESEFRLCKQQMN